MPASTTSPPVHESLLTRTQVSEAASSGTRPPRAPAAAIALGGTRAQSERCCAARGQRLHIHAHRRTALRLHQHQVMRIRLHPAWCADTSSVSERVGQWRSVSYAAQARIPQAKAARTCRGASISFS